MRALKVNQLKEGMIVSRDIIGKYDIIYLTRGTVLTEKYIKTIQTFNLNYIYITDENYDDLENNYDKACANINVKLNIEYTKALNAFKSVYTNIGMGNKIEIKNTNNIISPLVKEVVNNTNVLHRLNQIEVADEYTYTHSINVCILSTMIGKWLNFSKNNLQKLAIAALLHDIGKAMIPIEILNKPTKLTKEEFKIIKEHTIYGYNNVKDIEGIHLGIAYGILQHHERIDGTGYPLKIKGNQIHQFAKIIAVADIFDAMTAKRVYKPKESPFKVVELISSNSFGLLDPHICHVFLANIYKFYVGNIVRLNSGEIGKIILTNKHLPSKPLVKIDTRFIDLSKDYNYEIIEVIA